MRSALPCRHSRFPRPWRRVDARSADADRRGLEWPADVRGQAAGRGRGSRRLVLGDRTALSGEIPGGVVEHHSAAHALLLAARRAHANARADDIRLSGESAGASRLGRCLGCAEPEACQAEAMQDPEQRSICDGHVTRPRLSTRPSAAPSGALPAAVGDLVKSLLILAYPSPGSSTLGGD